MKTIIFIRHGKAENQSESGKDFDRKLSNKGRKQANVIGHLLKEKEVKIDQIISSDAARTKDTIGLISAILPYPSSKIDYQLELYLTDLKKYLDFCFNFDEKHENVAICGHNFGITDCLNYFTEQNVELSTCGTAIVSFDVNTWQEISAGTGKLEWMKLPKEIY